MRILITGASGRIGKSLGYSLLNLGHDVWGVAPSPSDILFSGYSICDVTNPKELNNILLADLSKCGWNHLDVLILAAAKMEPKGPALSIPLETWAVPLRTCLEGSFYPISVLFNLLKGSPTIPRRKIICFSGGGADRGHPGFSSASAAKAGLIRLVETLSLEWSNEPIDINILAPGSHRIPRSNLVGTNILNSPEFENLLNMIAFLISEQSDGFTGKWVSAQIHHVDFLKQNLKAWSEDSDEFTLRPKTPRSQIEQKASKNHLFWQKIKFFGVKKD